MAHWRLTPKQVKKLSEDEIDVLALAYRTYEKRWIESLSDLIGTLTGTSWDVDGLTAEQKNSDLEDVEFTWQLRPKRQRVSLPLTLVVGGSNMNVMEHVKKVAFDMKSKDRRDPSIMSLPASSILKDAEIVDLSRVPKEEFIQFTNNVISQYSTKKR